MTKIKLLVLKLANWWRSLRDVPVCKRCGKPMGNQECNACFDYYTSDWAAP